MPEEILGVVLALAIHVVSGFGQNERTILARAFAVGSHIFDSNLGHVRMFWQHIALGDGEAALAGTHLNSMVGDAQPNREPKGFG
jgi:hypothetical protein